MPPRTLSPDARRKLAQSRQKFLNKQPQSSTSQSQHTNQSTAVISSASSSVTEEQQTSSNASLHTPHQTSPVNSSRQTTNRNQFNNSSSSSSQRQNSRNPNWRNSSQRNNQHPKSRQFSSNSSSNNDQRRSRRDTQPRNGQRNLQPRDLSCLSDKRNKKQYTDSNLPFSSGPQFRIRPNNLQPHSDKSLQDLVQLDTYLQKVLLRVSTSEKHDTSEPMTSEWAFIDTSDVSDFHERIPEPAMDYPFELDEFQKRAILHVEMQSNVFVAAHTSAGKTVVAEYAIALSNQTNQKVIYTSPIKTLSNQKLRDFRTKFDDVGLVTGDVSINENANCVIMTTEILRSMLYKGADMIQDVAYVIFDEVQFFNDEERGVVWEESIIMLPSSIGIIMLSATVPNALEFASWVGKTKSRPVAVVATDKRPVPLEHSILYKGEDTNGKLKAAVLLQQGGIFDSNVYNMVLNSMRNQREKSKRDKGKSKSKAKHGKNESGTEKTTTIQVSEDQSLSQRKDLETQSKPKGSSASNVAKGETSAQLLKKYISELGGGKEGPNSRPSPWLPLLVYLEENEQTPAVIFCFSKKKCERAVESLGHCDLLPDASDKSFVHRFFQDSIKHLREEDKNLPQLKRMQDNLKRGISAHHAGLLPIVKEITEILFSKGLVKILFATETFAMGVNMPARTVVFGGIRKNDGKRFRDLEAGEYTQMSGRAGRRGLDKVGHVYLYFPPDENTVEEKYMRKVMTGKPLTLKSAFRLTYSMILNVLLADELGVEEMISGSFLSAGKDRTNEALTAALLQADRTLGTLSSSQGSSSDKAVSERTEKSKVFKQHSKNELDEYVQCYSRLLHEQSLFTVWDRCSFLRRTLSVGMVVAVELSPGRLALGVVFSIVGEKERIRKGSKLWVACITGVSNLNANFYRPTMFLLPQRFHDTSCIGTNTSVPEIVSKNGLHVSLYEIDVSNVSYVSQKIQPLSNQQISDQMRSTKQLHFGGNSVSLRTELTRCIIFLEKILCEWKLAEAEFNSFYQSLHMARKLRNGTNYVASWELNSVALFPNSTEIANFEDTNLYKVIQKKIIENKIARTMRNLKSKKEFIETGDLLPEYASRVKVLEELGYVEHETNTVQLKGRYACHVATANSIILTQVVVENVLHGLGPSEVASLLSSFVCRKRNSSGILEKKSSRFSLTHKEAISRMRQVVTDVGKVQENAEVSLAFEIGDANGYEDSICRWDLVEAVYLWAEGSPFCDITEVTEQQEGDIVVCIKRLSELLRDAQRIAEGVGNTDLFDVLEVAITAIRRDVIFNGSLYFEEQTLQQD